MSSVSQTPAELADDILRGASSIAKHIFGDEAEERKVYHLAESQALPVFRLGRILCARRSVLMRWIEEQEAQSTSSRLPSTAGCSGGGVAPGRRKKRA